jgi:hypothetical protein
MSDSLRTVLRQSTTEEKMLVLSELAAELFAAHGGRPVALTDGTSRTIGYLSPEVSAAEIAPLTADDTEEIRRRMAHLGRLLTVEEFTAELEAGEGGTPFASPARTTC